ncbi:UNVERIFIED_CONTAM: hypothetical protein Slati_2757000 [Sesamum latifolium]|uniref:DUF4218 domain-containing protein n=1 Tax=Sesamum latifolium TaxID=2727402 RepID=A0AAW2VXU6_9LAMI
MMPKAVYTLTREQKRRICEWITRLKFPDGYASSLARCVDMTSLRLHDMKSHDCHVFMKKLIPIAFREMLSGSVWGALIEVSLLFQIICSTTLDVNKVQELEDSVATIVCNLEKIFPPSFFDSMEHLIVHLPYEARVGGPVQYMWMYLFERPGRNDDLTMNDTRIQQSIFNFSGRASGALKKRWLNGLERHIIETYILTNCEVVMPYYDIGKSTFNYGVCVKSLSYTDTDSDFYGILEEVIQLDYPLIPNMQIVMFKCRWVDPVREGVGTSRAARIDSDDEPDEDSFEEDYETEENTNYD